jgi:hypothetical protein
MNVFDAIYMNEIDPIERSFIAIETAFEIAVASANKEYEFESNLISFNSEEIFHEATDAKKENAFVKFVKGICNAIRNLFAGIAESISNIFDTRKDINMEDVLKSSKAKVQLDKDINKLNDVVDDEIRKGNKLLQMISSTTGISDDKIDQWIQGGVEKIKQVAPVAITAGSAIGFNALIKKFFKKNNERIKEAEDITLGSSSDTDLKKQAQKKTVINHISSLSQTFGNAVSKAGSKITSLFDNEYKRAKREINEEYGQDVQKRAGAYGKVIDRYQSDVMDDESHLKAVNKLADSERSLKGRRKQQIADLNAKREQDRQAELIRKRIISVLDSNVRSNKITKNQKTGLETYINKQKASYDNGTLSFNDFKSRVQLSNLLKH